jgi:protein YIPF6
MQGAVAGSLCLQMFTLVLASLLSLGASNKEVAFCVVFVVVIVGAELLTANVVLLGGSVSFFQSLSLLGYCLFPLDVAAIVAFFVRPVPWCYCVSANIFAK